MHNGGRKLCKAEFLSGEKDHASFQKVLSASFCVFLDVRCSEFFFWWFVGDD